MRAAARVLHDRQASQIVLSEIRQAFLEVALCGACAGYFNLASLKRNRFRVVLKGKEEGRGEENRFRVAIKKREEEGGGISTLPC